MAGPLIFPNDNLPAGPGALSFPKDTETPWQEDVGRGFGAGVRRGVEGLAGLPGDVGRGQRWLTGKIMGALGADPATIEQVQKYTAWPQYLPGSSDISAKTDEAIGKPYEPTSRAGKYARTVGEFAPGVVGPGGPTRWLGRAATDVIIPALTSETAGQLTEGTMLEPWARAGTSILSGPAIGEMAKGRGPTEAAQRLMDKGFNLTAGQATDSKGLKYAESELGGGITEALQDRQKQHLTSQVMEGLGAPPGTTATTEEMAREYQRIGGRFNDLATQAGDLPLDVPAQQQLLDAQNQYRRATGNAAGPTMVDDTIQRIGAMLHQNPQNPAINGEQYQLLRSDIGKDIARARNAGDSATLEALQSYQDTLDNAMEAHLQVTNPGLAGQWADTRQQYRNYLDAERAVTSGSQWDAAEGLISPPNLRSGIRQVEGRRALAQGRGDYTDLANDAVSVLKPMPESGTSSRFMARLIPGAIGGAMLGGGVGAIPGAAMTMAAPQIAGRMLMSPPVQQSLMTPRAPTRQALALLLAEQQAQNSGGRGW